MTTRLVDEEITQFRNEARLMISMDHPHIVRVLDFGMQGPVPFIVMAYAPQGSLRVLHPRESQLPLSLVVTYVQQIASALQYIHDRKLIHRDVKPENMLVGENGTPALSDFGIAVIAHSERSMSQQDLGGTSLYMAPEQFQGKPRPASDQYALGIIVYEWLCGLPPFQGNIAQLAYQHSFVPSQPLHEKIPISRPVEEVVFKAIAKDPQHRFGCVQDFALALEEASQIDLSTARNESWQVLSTASATLLFSTRSEKADSTVVARALIEQGVTQQPSAGLLSEPSIPTVSSSYRTIPPDGQNLSTPFTSLYQPLSSTEQVSYLPSSEQTPHATLPGKRIADYPHRQVRRAKRRSGRLTLALVTGLVLAISIGVVLTLGPTFINNFFRSGNNGGGVSTASSFLNHIAHQDYIDAYGNLDTTLTVVTAPGDFSQQAQHDDRCYGRVTDYNETSASSATQGHQHITFTLTRAKLTKPYTLTFTLNQDAASGQWLIASYGNDLGPAPPICA